MVLNYIWVAFFLVAFVIAAVKLLFWGDYERSARRRRPLRSPWV